MSQLSKINPFQCFSQHLFTWIFLHLFFQEKFKSMQANLWHILLLIDHCSGCKVDMNFLLPLSAPQYLVSNDSRGAMQIGTVCV